MGVAAAESFEQQPRYLTMPELIQGLQDGGKNPYAVKLPTFVHDTTAVGGIGGAPDVYGIVEPTFDDTGIYDPWTVVRSRLTYVGRDETTASAIFVSPMHRSRYSRFAIPATPDECATFDLLNGRMVGADVTVQGDPRPENEENDVNIPATFATIYGLEPLFDGAIPEPSPALAREVRFTRESQQRDMRLAKSVLLAGKVTSVAPYDMATEMFPWMRSEPSWQEIRPTLAEIAYGEYGEHTVHLVVRPTQIGIQNTIEPYHTDLLPGDFIAARLDPSTPVIATERSTDQSAASMVIAHEAERFPMRLLEAGDHRRTKEQEEFDFMAEQITLLHQAESSSDIAAALARVSVRRYRYTRDTTDGVAISEVDRRVINTVLGGWDPGKLPVRTWLFDDYSFENLEDLQTITVAQGLRLTTRPILEIPREEFVEHCAELFDTLPEREDLMQEYILDLYRVGIKRMHEDGVRTLVSHILDNSAARECIVSSGARDKLYWQAYNKVQAEEEDDDLTARFIETLSQQDVNLSDAMLGDFANYTASSLEHFKYRVKDTEKLQTWVRAARALRSRLDSIDTSGLVGLSVETIDEYLARYPASQD